MLFRFWNVGEKKELTGLHRAAGEICNTAAHLGFFPSNHLMAYTTYPNQSGPTTGIYDTKSLQRLVELDDYLKEPRLSFSADGKLLLACTNVAPYLRIYKTSDGKPRSTLHPRYPQGHISDLLPRSWPPVHSPCVAPDETMVAFAGLDGTGYVFSADLKECYWTVELHTSSAVLAFSPDSKTLAAASGVADCKLFAARTGTHIMTLKGHEEGINTMSFSPDGAMLAPNGFSVSIA